MFEKLMATPIYDVIRDFKELKALIFNVPYVKKKNTSLSIVNDNGNPIHYLRVEGDSEILLIFHRFKHLDGRPPRYSYRDRI